MIINSNGLSSVSLLLCLWAYACTSTAAQGPAAAQAPAAAPAAGGTTYDLFLMPGSDFVRPGLKPRSNLNLGLGHTFAALHHDPLGDEVTFAYTYENAASHGFWHTDFGSHTEAAGVMRNFALPKSKALGAYTWIQLGVTSLTGNGNVQNRLYNGEALGLVLHLSPHGSIWLQETYNKVVTTPWYTSTNLGYVWSW